MVIEFSFSKKRLLTLYCSRNFVRLKDKLGWSKLDKEKRREQCLAASVQQVSALIQLTMENKSLGMANGILFEPQVMLSIMTLPESSEYIFKSRI